MNMEIELDPTKSAQENAALYFDKAKKLRKKAEGAREAIAKFAKKFEEEEGKEQKKEEKETKEKELKEKRKEKKQKQKWYEKFRWFVSSTGFLCVGGRDATTNEIIIKKHTDKDDFVFHTESPGSPFFVIKAEGKKIDDATKQEAASATVMYSKAWKRGLTTTEVYGIKPEQVSKQAQAGQYLSKGAFMIYGKREYFNVSPQMAVGKMNDERVMGGPVMAVKTNCEKYLLVQNDKMKTSECAKKIAKYLDVDIDDVVRVLPSGGGKPKLPTGQDLR
jgi:predicted ribosome quality control (RQC) complex YloA/Tae2 family protein